MPKKTYKILRFEGGLDSNSDPRDIADNQFAELQNFAVDEIGKLKISGAVRAELYDTLAYVPTAHGYGVIAFASDYSGFVDGAVTQQAKYYYAMESGGGVNFADPTGSESTGIVALTDKTGIIMYWVDGALRMYDITNGPLTPTVFTPKWRGYIEGYMLGSDESTSNARYKGHIWLSSSGSNSAKANGWYSEDAQIKGCFPEAQLPTSHGTAGVMVGQNLIAGNHRILSGHDTTASTANANDYVNYTLAEPTGLFAFADEQCGTGTGPTAPENFNTSSGMRWGHGLGLNESKNDQGTWCPTGSETYQFWCTTIYDDNQESAPQLFTMYNPGNQTTDWSDHKLSHSTPVTSMRFKNAANRGQYANGIALWVEPIIKWCDALHDNTTDWANSGDDRTLNGIHYNFGGDTVDAHGAGKGNPRITGLKVYWAGSEDGFSDLWLLYEWNFKKGVRSWGSATGSGGSYREHDYTSAHMQGALASGHYWYHHTHACEMSDTYGFKSWDESSGVVDAASGTTGIIFIDPPKYIRYDAVNAHSTTETVTVDAFKAVCIANRRTWIGNVTINGIKYADRMLKSPVNQFDKFPAEANQIEVSINDGDEIIALMEYADRLLQFKKNKLYIINISGATEFLESEHKYKGANNIGAVAKTDYGIAWANNNGCYLYDGKQVLDLLESKGARKISIKNWSSFIGAGTGERVGYNPERRQIIIKGASSAGYIYDMITKSFSYSSQIVDSGTNKSPFFNRPDNGNLVFFDTTSHLSQQIDTWIDTFNSGSIILATKDVDFGEPSVRKKLYKIYVTYRGDGSSIVENFRTNGGTTDYTFTSGFGNQTDPYVWTRQELKPSNSSDANNIYSCQLRLTGSCNSNFEINDITFVYRSKTIN
jgi:hypothetical protein